MAASARLGLKVRSFSTTVIKPVSKLVMPPIQVFGVEGRYATALYSAASKEKKLDQVEQELTKIIIKSQVVVMQEFYLFFSDLLAENGRLRQTPDVVSAFSKIMSAHRGEVLCSVTTAQTLDEGNLSELKTALSGFLKKGETLKLETKTDASILGGMIVSVGDKYADMSTKTKIQKLSKLINEAI
ncbi:ATP synthase subunit O, mitochondrial [Scyliorhinus torazame]|uniref:ATP synthase subunit O, mitochondrial n=1 Tax=Scyliorhinus torazame TaxID=75743 RepID=UPI003B5B4418